MAKKITANAGVHVGRVAVRATGSFNIQLPGSVLQGISHRYCKIVSRADGYAFSLSRELLSLPTAEAGDFLEKIR